MPDRASGAAWRRDAEKVKWKGCMMAPIDSPQTSTAVPEADLKKFTVRQPRIGLFVGAMEWYWTMTGMEDLKAVVLADGRRLAALLAAQGIEVISTDVVSSHGRPPRPVVGSVMKRWTLPSSITAPTSATR